MMWISPFDYHYILLDCALPELRGAWYLHSKYADCAHLLYDTTRFSGMHEISPLIAPTDEKDPFLHWLHANRLRPEMHNWGCLLHCTEPAETLAGHFRSWITVYDDIGQEVFFRFYDPDILPHFAAALTGRERQQFFGPVNAFLYRERNKDLLTAIQAQRGGPWSPDACEPLGPCPAFTIQERHVKAMLPVFHPFLVREIFTRLYPRLHIAASMPMEHIHAKIGECLRILAALQGTPLPEVEDATAFCLLAMTSCSHFYQSQEFQHCVQRKGMSETLDEWRHYAHAPIPGLELWHDPHWLSAQADPQGEDA